MAGMIKETPLTINKITIDSPKGPIKVELQVFSIGEQTEPNPGDVIPHGRIGYELAVKTPIVPGTDFAGLISTPAGYITQATYQTSDTTSKCTSDKVLGDFEGIETPGDLAGFRDNLFGRQ